MLGKFPDQGWCSLGHSTENMGRCLPLGVTSNCLTQSLGCPAGTGERSDERSKMLGSHYPSPAFHFYTGRQETDSVTAFKGREAHSTSSR